MSVSVSNAVYCGGPSMLLLPGSGTLLSGSVRRSDKRARAVCVVVRLAAARPCRALKCTIRCAGAEPSLGMNDQVACYPIGAAQGMDRFSSPCALCDLREGFLFRLSARLRGGRACVRFVGSPAPNPRTLSRACQPGC